VGRQFRFSLLSHANQYKDSLSRGGWDAINQLNPAIFFCLIPSQELDFQRHILIMFNDLN
jgi:hypothetical protein